jgi:endoglucanase
MTNITFAAMNRMTGQQLQSSVPVNVTYNRKPAFTVSAYESAPIPAPTPTPTPNPVPSPTPTPTQGSTLYKAPQQIDNLVKQYPEINVIADQPVAVWLAEWSGDIKTAVKTICDKAKALNQIPQLVVYNIPNRDNGGYSKGGLATDVEYRKWIDALVTGITTPAIIILEPDAIVHHTDATRIELIKYAADKLMSTGSKVYIDAGHPNWHPAEETAKRLHLCNVKAATGFALNTSNFVATDICINYGEDIAKRLSGLGAGEKRFVVDTSRNGNGANGEWCNPVGRKIGLTPILKSMSQHSDALLWVKAPGESDGTCAGGPNAGQFWVEYARGLVKGVA